MKGTFLSKTFRYYKEDRSERTTHTKISSDRIKTLIEFFPIGKKLHYYPEFNKDILLETLVVAYCVDGHFVYSLESIDRDSDGNPTAFRSGENQSLRIQASELTQLQLLVPDTSHLEMKLDYLRRAQISRRGQFSIGNYITLVSNTGIKGVSTLDTEVAKQVTLHEGPYGNMDMILLTPEMNTLSVTDQRKNPRTKLNVPATVFFPAEKPSELCTIIDISNAELRICMSDRRIAMPFMEKGEAMIIEIKLGEKERHYSIKGSIIRRSQETCIVKLDGQVKDGRLVEFGPLDLLELKAGLLNFSN